MAENVTIFEMGPRDGLQNEAAIIATADKITLVDMLSDCGFTKIEVTSFVSPKWVPQMADAADVMAGIIRKPGVSYAALTPNLRGFEAALAAGATEIAVFASASEGFSQANINCSIAESLDRFAPVIYAAKKENIPVRGYVSCVVSCPYDGPTGPVAVRDVAQSLRAMGCYEISLGDTTGNALPEQVATLLDTVAGDLPLAGHFHDTGGRALDNIIVALDYGLRVFDASIGGLGGCPYAPGAKGNVATEKVASMLTDMGYGTGLDLGKLAKCSLYAKGLRNV